MSERESRNKTTPRHAVVSRAGVKYYIRTVQGAARQHVISLPAAVRQETGLWRGRLVYLWVVNGVIMIKPLKQDIVNPEEAA